MSPSSRALRHAALAALAAIASGCTTVGPDFARPEAPKTSAYGAQGEAAPAEAMVGAAAVEGPWWNALGSPALDAVIRQALAGSPTLAEADATLRQAQSALAEARGQAGPKVDATAGVNRERANLQAFGFTSFGDITLSNPTFSLYSLGGSVGYDLDIFGGNRRRVEAAAARAEAQERRAEAAYLTLTSNVALQAVTIAALSAQIEAVNQMIAADEQNVQLVHKANELGGSTSTAKVAAQSQLEQDRALLPPLNGQLNAARHALAMLVGKAPADWAPPSFDLAEMKLSAPVPVALPTELVRKRPDILAAEAELHAATADIGVATADLYPKFPLTASFTQGALKPENIFSYDASAWNIGAGVTAPIFHSGALKARRQEMREAAQAANARYQHTVLNAFVQVADALSALSADDELLASYERSGAHAQENLRLARSGFSLGGSTMLEVLDAQRRANEIRASQARAQGQRLADAVRLFVASGGDWRVKAAT